MSSCIQHKRNVLLSDLVIDLTLQSLAKGYKSINGISNWKKLTLIGNMTLKDIAFFKRKLSNKVCELNLVNFTSILKNSFEFCSNLTTVNIFRDKNLDSNGISTDGNFISNFSKDNNDSLAALIEASDNYEINRNRKRVFNHNNICSNNNIASYTFKNNNKAERFSHYYDNISQSNQIDIMFNTNSCVSETEVSSIKEKNQNGATVVANHAVVRGSSDFSFEPFFYSNSSALHSGIISSSSSHSQSEGKRQPKEIKVASVRPADITFSSDNKVTFENEFIADPFIIEESAFYDCSSLKSITFPNNLQKICGCAFKNCANIRSITFPSSLKDIGVSAFENCRSLEEVNFSALIGNINVKAFYGCSLKIVKLYMGSLIDICAFEEQVEVLISKSKKDLSNLTLYFERLKFKRESKIPSLISFLESSSSSEHEEEL